MAALLSFAAIAACTSVPLKDVEFENYDLNDEDVLRVMGYQETDNNEYDDDDLEDFAKLMSIIPSHSANHDRSMTQKHESKQAQGKDDVTEDNDGIFTKEDKELDVQGGVMNRLKQKLKKLRNMKVLKKKLRKMLMRFRG